MSKIAYFDRAAAGQMIGRMMTMNAGLNTYSPAIGINDNCLSEAVDISCYRGQALYGIQYAANVAMILDGSTQYGDVLCAISDPIVGSPDNEALYILVWDSGAGAGTGMILKRLVISPSTIVITNYDITASWAGTTAATGEFDATAFQTAAARYICFTNQNSNILVYHKTLTTAPYTVSIDVVTLPFNPRRLVSHANRVFAIDDKNSIWWCAAGDLTGWYGSTRANSYVNEDAGYWTIETEVDFSEISVINNVLYVFSRNNIYAFRGYDYDTFSMGLVIAGIGVDRPTMTYKTRLLASSNNISYFYYNGDVFQFDGSNYPSIISRQTMVGGNVSNSLIGGIEVLYPTVVGLVADKNFLYVYRTGGKASAAYPTYTDFFKFDIRERTWWKISGFNLNQTFLVDATEYHVLCVPKIADGDGIHAIISVLRARPTLTMWDGGSAYPGNFLGFVNSAVSSKPAFVSKSFSSAPSNEETLTDVIINFQATAGVTVVFDLYKSYQSSGGTFGLCAPSTSIVATGDIQTLQMPLYPDNATYSLPGHHYRLKLAFTSGTLIFGFERRYRTKGRSR